MPRISGEILTPTGDGQFRSQENRPILRVFVVFDLSFYFLEKARNKFVLLPLG
jgi:hypothetical protein